MVTGLGTVGSYGCGADSLAAALAAGRPTLSEIDRSAGFHREGGARRAALVAGTDFFPWLAPGSARRMSAPSRFAVATAQMALEQAGLPSRDLGSAAVVLSTSFGPSLFTEKLIRSIESEGPVSASPFLFTECVANAPAAQVAIASAATGPNITVVQREAGPLLAAARGAEEVASGRVTRALVGSVDELTPAVHAILDRFGALARPSGAGGEVARPFDRRRHGMLAAEGASVLVLEEEEEARRRKAPIRARLRAWGSAFDPTASRVGWGRGHVALANAIRRGLDRASLGPADLDRIVSGASGTIAGDRLEGHTLRSVWAGDAFPPVVAPKGVTGEYGGGFLAAAMLAVQETSPAKTAGFEEPDVDVGVTPHLGGTLPSPTRAFVLSLAAGGGCGWLVVERP